MIGIAKRNWVVFSLLLLAAVQLTLLSLRSARGDETLPGFVGVGDTLADLRFQGTGGADTPLGDGVPTVLLVFNSHCAYCATVAPAWKAWLREHRSAGRVMAVASEPLGSAMEFARSQGWEVKVDVLEPGSSRGLGEALTRRTPWIFVMDGAGVILAEGHGEHIAELTAGGWAASGDLTEK